MLLKLSQPGLILGILGLGKLILSNFGINIEDQYLNELANGISAILVVISIFMDHGKTRT